MKKILPAMFGFLLSLMLSLIFSLGTWAAPEAVEASEKQLQHYQLDHKGKNREYFLFRPTSCQTDQPMPLLLVFHGYLGSARQMMNMTRFNALAEQEGFLVAYANAIDDRWHVRSSPRDATNEDVTFVQAMLAQIQKQYPVDPQRIYATGFSNGGFFVHRLACELSDQIAAVATVASTMGVPLTQTCQPARPMPVLMINGRRDPVVLWKGDFRKVKHAFRDAEITSVPEMVAFWQERNRCQPTPQEMQPEPKIRVRTFPQCQAPAEVRQIIVTNGGHTWPGMQPGGWLSRLIVGKTNRDIDASREIYDFFKRHRLPPKQPPVTRQDDSHGS